MCVCVCVLFEFRQFFFTLGTRLRIDFCKKTDRTRCLAVQFLSTILTRIRIRQSERKRFGFRKEERNSVVIRRVNIGDPAYRIV